MKVRFIGRTRISKRPKYEVLCPNHMFGPMREVHFGLEEALTVAENHLNQRHTFAFQDRDMVWWMAQGQRIRPYVKGNKRG